MDIDPNDLNVSQYRSNPQEGGWSLNPQQGVRIIHKPSGCEASYDMDRSAHKNRVEAMRLLQIKVDAWGAAGRPAPAGSTPSYAPVPNPHKVDFAQMRRDMDDGMLKCRDGILKALDYGIELQKRFQPADISTVAATPTTGAVVLDRNAIIEMCAAFLEAESLSRDPITSKYLDDVAGKMRAELKTIKVGDHVVVNVKITPVAHESHKHGVVEGGKTGPVDSCAATSSTDPDEGGKRVASVDTDNKEQ